MAGLFEETSIPLVDLHTIPLFHANGWGRPQASTMLGVKQIMVRRFEPTGVFKLIQQHHATRHEPGADHGQRTAQCSGSRARYDVSSMRKIMLGGAASSPELIERMEKAFICEALQRLWTDRNGSRVDLIAAESRCRGYEARSGIGGTPWRDGPCRACGFAWSIRT